MNAQEITTDLKGYQFLPRVHQVPSVGLCRAREIALKAPLPSSGIESHA